VTGRRAADLPDGAWPWLHDFARWLGTWLFAPVFRLRVHHADRVPATGPLVVVVNHSSLLDGPIVYGMLGRRSVFLIKQEVYTGPLKVILPRIGQLAVRRGMPDRTPLLAAVRVLKAGGVVGVFPEGSRGDGGVAAAENGAAWLARSAGATVLPIACRGTRKGAGPAVRGGLRRRVDVLVGAPITPAAAKGRTGLAAATEQVRTALADLVVELDRLRAGAAPGEPGAGSGEFGE
jgi:1-acyl-sn-glycerol-3-phosphate acyltransferase